MKKGRDLLYTSFLVAGAEIINDHQSKQKELYKHNDDPIKRIDISMVHRNGNSTHLRIPQLLFYQFHKKKRSDLLLH